jgi:SsrA-binding protein
MAKKKDKKNREPRIDNRKARHQYHIEDKLEVGIALLGSEIKSIRLGEISLAEGFARVEPKTGELWLHGVHIAPYAQATGTNAPDANRSRKLLAHKREIRKLVGQTSAKGATLVPLALYFVRGRAKLEIGVATGKTHQDKRQDLKSKDADRDMRRAMTRKRL